MGKQYFDAFLLGAIWTSVIMATIWVLRYRSKGPSAILMGIAFLAFASLSWTLRSSAPNWITYTCGAVVALSLLADIGVRSARQAKEADDKQLK